jgi:hypothetical protein
MATKTPATRKPRASKKAATPDEQLSKVASADLATFFGGDESLALINDVFAKPAKPAKASKARTVTTTTTAMAELIAAVREFAARPRNYNNGWDLVVESYTDETLAEMIYKARTTEGAIANVRTFIKDAHSSRQEIQNTAF